MANTKAKAEAVQSTEIESLNVNDLDIEELEQRIELAAATHPADPAAWICGVDCPNLQSVSV